MLYNLFENRDFVSVFAVALREEGDRFGAISLELKRDLWRRPPRGGRQVWRIHALREEGDTLVALREEGDRFGVADVPLCPLPDGVALREEGDRFGACPYRLRRCCPCVALREEGDRFGAPHRERCPHGLSVALREEGDRFGEYRRCFLGRSRRSPSARRATGLANRAATKKPKKARRPPRGGRQVWRHRP